MNHSGVVGGRKSATTPPASENGRKILRNEREVTEEEGESEERWWKPKDGRSGDGEIKRENRWSRRGAGKRKWVNNEMNPRREGKNTGKEKKKDDRLTNRD